MFKLFTIMDNKFYITTEDSKIPRDYDVALEIDMSVGEYRELLIYQFHGKKSHITEDLSVKSNNIYFTSQEDADNALAWLDSILVADKLRGKKKDSMTDHWLKYIDAQIMQGLGIPKEYLGETQLGCDLNKFIPNKNGRVYIKGSTV